MVVVCERTLRPTDRRKYFQNGIGKSYSNNNTCESRIQIAAGEIRRYFES